uniref:DNA cytosine methyltransferase n=1 Tax=Escherichia coli TaxID=562 RepID=A0A6N0IMQ3_ECOLX|nr:DNA cytosine methyltransferase [Escherichia coli]
MIFWLAALHAKVLVFNALLVAITMTVILLIDDYGDLIRALLPKFFFIGECTKHRRKKRGKAILEKFKADMAKLGYLCHEQIIDAQDYGVPQRRKRYILVGEFTTNAKPSFAWPQKKFHLLK